MDELEPAGPDEATIADVVVVGAGPAGIAAASAAAETGALVVVVDMAPRLGGQIWRHTDERALPRPARRWLSRFRASGAFFLPRTTVVDAAGHRLLLDLAGEPMGLEGERIVIATGARELFLPFPGWTHPNVVGVGGAQALLKGGANFAGKRVVVAGSGPLVLPLAALLAGAGAELVAVAEQAPARAVWTFAAGLWRSADTLVQAARYRAAFAGTRYRTGTWVAEARGDTQVREVVLTDGAKTRMVGCDVLCAAYGLIPNTELAQLLGCTLVGGAVSVDSRQRTSVDGVLCAGEPTGIAGLDAALAQGEIAGMTAVGGTPRPSALRTARRAEHVAARIARAFAPRTELLARVTGETVVCRCEDVRAAALVRCHSAREAKLLTRAGMGPCQGRICAPAMQALYGWEPGPVRPPLFPVPLETVAGETSAPVASA